MNIRHVTNLIHGTGFELAQLIYQQGFQVSCPDETAPPNEQVNCYFGKGVYFYWGGPCRELATRFAKKHETGALIKARVLVEHHLCCDFNEEWLETFDHYENILTNFGMNEGNGEACTRLICNMLAEEWKVRLFMIPDGVIMQNLNPEYCIVVARYPEDIHVEELERVD